MSRRQTARFLGILLALVLVLVPLVALADNVQNDVVAGGNDMITVGGSTSVGYYIEATGAKNACDAQDGSPATVHINTPSQVSAEPASLEFSTCGSDNAQAVSVTSGEAGSYVITVSVADANGDYNGSPAKFTLKVNASRTTPLITWSNPADIIYGTALSGTQLNATAMASGSAVAGTFAYEPAEGTVLDAGSSQALKATFSPTDSSRYNGGSATVHINVLRANQAITFGALADKTYGDEDLEVSATGGASGNPVTFAASGNCTVSGSAVQITGAGSCTITASQAGNSNYNAAPDVWQSFSIAKADASVSVNGYSGVYDGATHGATGTATGVKGEDLISLLDLGDSFTDVPGGTANWSFAGNTNYKADSGSVEVVISKAESTVTVSCNAGPFTYTGSAITPCTANVTGAGGLNQSLAVIYSNNVNAGTATASASFGGDPNHKESTDSSTFTIARAPSTVIISCPASVTYNGSAQTPCSAAVTGAGGLDQSLPVSYTNNTNAGAATASANFAGDDNHLNSSDSETFTINRAESTTTVTCPTTPLIYTGSAQTPCTASVTGVGGLSQSVPLTYKDNVNVGTATASASFAGDDNHTGSTDSETFEIRYGVCALYDQTKAHKAGSTVPLKIQLCDANGANVSSSSVTVKATSITKLDNSASNLVVEDSGNANPDLNFRYDPTLGGTGGYIYNLQTKGYKTGSWNVTFTVAGAASGNYFVTFDIK